MVWRLQEETCVQEVMSSNPSTLYLKDIFLIYLL